MMHGEQCLGELCQRLQEKRKGNFVPWIVLGCDTVSPILNIYIEFIRHVYFCWMSEYDYKT